MRGNSKIDILRGHYNRRTKSGLIYATELSHKQAIPRFNELEEKGLIFPLQDGYVTQYFITKRGKDLLLLLRKQFASLGVH